MAGMIGITPDLTSLLRIKDTLLRRSPLGIQQQSVKNGIFLGSLMEGGSCCAVRETEEETYTLLCTGNLFNGPELRKELHTDALNPAELILSAYLKWGTGCLTKLTGGFTLAVYEEKKKRLFLARDPLGICPLYYHRDGDRLLFATEQKTLLAAPGLEAALDRQGAMELILLSPGRRPGSGVFRGIRELEPGCCGTFGAGKLELFRYWKLRDGFHGDSFEETARKVRLLVTESMERQLEDCREPGTFLSGGLDSSILSSLAAERQGTGILQTFSVDYLHNDRNFRPGRFQPDSDDQYIEIMAEYLGCRHRKTILTPEDLMNQLEEATLARDLPGMGDVDFSLLAFCKEVRKQVPLVFSGECADEIFGGYPWFRDPAQETGFPWARNTAFRNQLMENSSRDGEDFVKELYLDSCREADILPGCSPQDRKIREMTYLNLRWFMQTLLERNDRMSAWAGLQVRVPFCDVKIAEYLYRVPWAFKNDQGREKGLLRYSFRDLLPQAVTMRKKSPYPKTFDPAYTALVTGKVRDLLVEDSPVWYLLSRKTVSETLEKGTMEPFYGQLMRMPQFAAWILQTDFWLKHYNIRFCW